MSKEPSSDSSVPSLKMAVAAPGQDDVVVEDGADAISYSSNQWSTFTNPSIYHGGTEHATYNVSATAVLSFTGTYVWFFGDSNKDHGRLSASVDGGAPQTYTTFSSAYKPATQALFGLQLDAGSHVLTITNLDDHKAVGVDYFAFRPLANIEQGVDVHSTDAQVSYSGAGWNVGRTSYQLTYSGGASVSFTFEGSSISYISDKNHDHGRFQVSLDDGPGSVFSSYSPIYEDVQVLFTTTVTPGKHTIKVTNLDEGKAIGVDHFSFVPVNNPQPPPPPPASPAASTGSGSQTPGSSIVASPTVSPTTTLPSTDISSSLVFDSGTAVPTPSGQSSLPQPMKQTTISTGVIVGIVLASISVVLFGILFVIMFRRRASRRSTPLPPPVQDDMSQPWAYSQPVAGPAFGARPQLAAEATTPPSYAESESQVNGSDGGSVSRLVPYPVTRTKS